MNNYYPIELDCASFAAISGRDIREELGENTEEATALHFIEEAQGAVYDLIYSKGGKAFKDRLINANLQTLQGPLSRAIVCQVLYQIDAGGTYAETDGSNITPDGRLELTEQGKLREKIVAPGVRDILHAVVPDLLAGVI